MKVSIITSAHWDGDPRLNRHVRYLNRAGFEADIVSFDPDRDGGRSTRALQALAAVFRSRSDVVILPDPELFIPGSLIARLRGIHCVIDIHENFSKAVASRAWVPRWLKPVLRWGASANDWIGRKTAQTTVVAANELARPGAIVVLNIPDPDDFPAAANVPERTQAVYVGDVTEARGALDIADLAALLPEVHFLVVGRVDDTLAAAMRERSGNSSNLELAGRLEHDMAWELAAGSIAGLSLLRPLPAYRDATATKLWEYAASLIPPVVTDLSGQRRFVSAIDEDLAGASLDDLASIITRLASDKRYRIQVAARAREFAIESWSAARPDLAITRAVSPAR